MLSRSFLTTGVVIATFSAAASGFAPVHDTFRHGHHLLSSSVRTSSGLPLYSSSTSDNNLFDSVSQQLTSLFAPKDEVRKEPKKPVLPDVVINRDFKLAAAFLILGLLLDTIPYVQILLGLPITLLGILFLVQTFRIRFVFESDSFTLKTGNDDNLSDTGENIVVGGENRWTYDSFVNYDFFPRGWIDQPQGPILVYFKETQTPETEWNTGPGAKANSEEAIAAGAVPGQVHFFPALCDAKQIRAEFERRGCAKL
eukprot:CAMPEP_0172481728 /NCGR_PEP_ID=MMETSP1066-20121228/7810_1 /TAXON_ID=671091 /ORGANISM="Coscinodiscus wailesii, Strain CCMP2513" /LENGTH=254 /DNA_ID=CAMNT_0013244291 /DNA_START=143 /DNA_END=907 /DNA_ORIENTATION=+